MMGRFIPTVGKIVAGRGRGMFILNALTTFSVLFKMFSWAIPAKVRNEIWITSGNSNETLLEMVAPE